MERLRVRYTCRKPEVTCWFRPGIDLIRIGITIVTIQLKALGNAGDQPRPTLGMQRARRSLSCSIRTDA